MQVGVVRQQTSTSSRTASSICAQLSGRYQALKTIGPIPADILKKQQERDDIRKNIQADNEKCAASIALFVGKQNEGEAIAYNDSLNRAKSLASAYQKGMKNNSWEELLSRMKSFDPYMCEHVERLLSETELANLKVHVANDYIEFGKIWDKGVWLLNVEPIHASIAELVQKSPNAQEDLKWNEGIVLISMRRAMANDIITNAVLFHVEGHRDRIGCTPIGVQVGIELAKRFQAWKVDHDDRAFAHIGVTPQYVEDMLDGTNMRELRVYADGQLFTLKDVQLEFARIFLLHQQVVSNSRWF